MNRHDTVTVNLNGHSEVNIEITPYFMISNEQLARIRYDDDGFFYNQPNCFNCNDQQGDVDFKQDTVC